MTVAAVVMMIGLFLTGIFRWSGRGGPLLSSSRLCLSVLMASVPIAAALSGLALGGLRRFLFFRFIHHRFFAVTETDRI